MNAPEHMPTPWLITEEGADNSTIIVCGDPERKDYIRIVGGTAEQNHAAAKFIVRAVNAYETLLSNMQSIASRGPDDEPEEEDYDDTESAYGNGLDVAYWDCAEMARKALSWADGEG